MSGPNASERPAGEATSASAKPGPALAGGQAGVPANAPVSAPSDASFHRPATAATSNPPTATEAVIELADVRKVYRQILAPAARPGGFARLFGRKPRANAPSLPQSPDPNTPPPLEAPGGGGVEVLTGIDLTIRAGEFVALQGTSGSGKSTLLHLLGLLDTPTSGTYRLLGRDVSGLSDEEASALRGSALGFVFQSFYLVPYATALENVMLPGLYTDRPEAELRQRARALLAQVGLADRMDFKPANLSGGQQQRVAMARALLNAPRVILADEPTGQLDSATSAEIMRLFASVNAGGTTIVLVTHDEQVAARAQRIIRIVDGRIVDDAAAGPTPAPGRDKTKP